MGTEDHKTELLRLFPPALLANEGHEKRGRDTTALQSQDTSGASVSRAAYHFGAAKPQLSDFKQNGKLNFVCYWYCLEYMYHAR